MFVEVSRPVRPYADLTGITEKEILDRGWKVLEGPLAEDGIAGNEVYFVQFAVTLTAAEEVAIRRRLNTVSTIEETLHERAVAAYQDLQSFENLTTPTNAQVVAVVRLLCKVVRGLIRLQLRRLDAVD